MPWCLDIFHNYGTFLDSMIIDAEFIMGNGVMVYSKLNYIYVLKYNY